MRAGTFLACLLLVIAIPALALAAEGNRYGVPLDVKTYPQSTPKESMASVIKAIGDKNIRYLVAHLADPDFVDDRVKRIYGGKFAEQVQDTQARLDPSTVKLLKRFLKDGKWTIDKTTAGVDLDDVKNKTVRFVKKSGRWYLEHRSGK
jgi:hypothetical protein